MVRRLLADHLSSAGPSVDRAFFVCHRPEDGLHAGAIDRDTAANGRGLSFRQALGR